MHEQPPGGTATHPSSAGHILAEAGYLDDHYAACRAEYEAMLRAVSLQPGWRVLDAGCGGGAYLALLAELVGPAGRIAALDLAPENIATVRHRIDAAGLPCPVEARVGSILALPYADAAFDAIWCANVSAYLTDEELGQALGEFRRVVRPGGLVAIKEADNRLATFDPADPRLVWRWLCANEAQQQHGGHRARGLPGWLARAGLVEVWARTTFIERRAPLRPVERPFIASILGWFAAEAQALPLPDTDKARWRAMSDAGSPAYLLEQPDFCYCEGSVVAVGRTPVR